jgi:predicted nucleic-acid-binding Zn-ribbon protein
LRLGEYNDLKWCFNEDFAEETIFKTGEEFERKLFNLENNPELYKKCLNRQYELFNKYFNKEWIRNYIENYLD